MKYGIGQSVTRKEDPKFLMGRGCYDVSGFDGWA
jgi:hypothetical protein